MTIKLDSYIKLYNEFDRSIHVITQNSLYQKYQIESIIE